MVHQSLPAFYGGSFNCEQGKVPDIKPACITKIIPILKQNQEALDFYLTENLWCLTHQNIPLLCAKAYLIARNVKGQVAELPDVAEYADSFEEAYTLALDTIETTAAIFEQQGKSLPLPFVHCDEYSGRITLRLAKSLHRALANAADNEGVRLNQHLTNVLN